MPKLDLVRMVQAKGSGGEILQLKGPGFSWVKPSQPARNLVVSLLGQSQEVANAGVGELAADFPGRVFQYNQAGSVVPATTVLDHVTAQNGEPSAALQWAIRHMADNPDDTITFVPHASDGTGYDVEWQVGGALHEGAIARTNACMALDPSYEFYAIHMQIGEEDSLNSESASFAARQEAAVADLRARVTGATSSTPVIFATMLPSWVDLPESGETDQVQALIGETAQRIAHSAVVDTTYPRLEGRNVTGDRVHYNGDSLLAIGSKRYDLRARAMANTPAVIAAAPVVYDNEIWHTGDTFFNYVSRPSKSGTTHIRISTSAIDDRDATLAEPGIPCVASLATIFTATDLTPGTQYYVHEIPNDGTTDGVATVITPVTTLAALGGQRYDTQASARFLTARSGGDTQYLYMRDRFRRNSVGSVQVIHAQHPNYYLFFNSDDTLNLIMNGQTLTSSATFGATGVDYDVAVLLQTAGTASLDVSVNGAVQTMGGNLAGLNGFTIPFSGATSKYYYEDGGPQAVLDADIELGIVKTVERGQAFSLIDANGLSLSDLNDHTVDTKHFGSGFLEKAGSPFV